MKFACFKSCPQSTAATSILIRSAVINSKSVQGPSTGQAYRQSSQTKGMGPVNRTSLEIPATLLTAVLSCPATQSWEVPAHTGVNRGETGRMDSIYAVMSRPCLSETFKWYSSLGVTCDTVSSIRPLSYQVDLSRTVTLLCHWCPIWDEQAFVQVCSRKVKATVYFGAKGTIYICPHLLPYRASGWSSVQLPLLYEQEGSVLPSTSLSWSHECLAAPMFHYSVHNHCVTALYIYRDLD